MKIENMKPVIDNLGDMLDNLEAIKGKDYTAMVADASQYFSVMMLKSGMERDTLEVAMQLAMSNLIMSLGKVRGLNEEQFMEAMKDAERIANQMHHHMSIANSR